VSVVSALEVRERPFRQTKGDLSSLRGSGFIPAIIYGGAEDVRAVSVSMKEFRKELSIPGIRTRIFKLGPSLQALVKDIQFDPVKDEPIHVDFYRLTKGSRVPVRVSVHFVNEDKSPGLKKGGVLNIVLHTIELSVMAQNIPNEIIVDLSGLGLGASLHVRDLSFPEGANFLHVHEDDTVATIVAPSGLISTAEEGEKAAESAASERE